jgi:hypothetical protein
MSVKAKKIVRGVGRLEYATSASDILQEDHPVHKHFVQWLGDKKATKRQAAKFLQRYPQYREIH